MTRKSTKPTRAAVVKAPEKPPLEGLSQEEAARRVGCSQSTIGRALARGDIEPLANGRIPESAVEVLRGLRQDDAKNDADKAALERRLLAAETGEREAKMELAKLRLERESGRFVELEHVQRAGADAAQRILAVLRAIPQRVSLDIDAALAIPTDRRAAGIERIVSREVERAVAEMRDSMFLQAGVAPPAKEAHG